MKTSLLRLSFLVLLAFVSLANSSFAAEVQGVALRAAAQETFAAAEAAYREGNQALALSRFRSFVLSHHDSELTPVAYTYLGRIFIQQHRYTDALLYLERVAKNARLPEVQLLSGYSLIMAGENDPGFSQLLGIAGQTFSPADQQLLDEGLALAYSRRDEPLKALYFYQQALPGATDPQKLLQSAHHILKNNIDSSMLREASFLFSAGPIGQDARLQLARYALTEKDQKSALNYLSQILASPISFPWRTEAAQLMDRFSQGSWLQKDAIGVLLPLSGRYETYGKMVKRGIDLALKLHNAEKPPLRLLYRDTEADPTKARQATMALANEERVMAILGPLTSGAALSAATSAQQNRTPLLAFSQRAAIPEIGPYIFRDSLTPRMQARALARYAILEKGFHSFGILAPENRLGREMSELFTEEVIKLGGLVIDEQTYAEDANDFRPQILHLMGKSAEHEKTDYRQKTETQRLDDLFVPDEPDYPPTTFDALFIPDYANHIGLIAPQLAFYGIQNFPLLGISGWNSPELLRLAGRYVEGAVFVDGFFLDSPYPFVKEFIDLYVETYGEPPSLLEAQAFDCANILFAQLESPTVTDRDSLRAALAKLQNYPGVTGSTSFDFTGEADKVLFQLQIKDGAIRQLN
ncbi:ABC transporter substrate-binding protein [Geopsychrobacter electrodiphilus]|uniref:ABC transporter substrate-binding protein n=1 Tax=Geopsychrobacter electrodiphilus TaxID=225196 RepID=UPI000368B343|nr:ABC transporter substrate-binding protein [Geopsychrobacter electrodiphilus]